MTQPDMQEILAQAQKMQEELQRTQAEIMATEATGEAGNGLVKATMNGSGEVIAVEISPEVVDPDDVDTLQDLIVGAINNAYNAIAATAEEKMSPLQASFGQPDQLGGLFG